MSLTTISRTLRALFRRDRADQELDEEMAFHSIATSPIGSRAALTRARPGARRSSRSAAWIR